MKQKIVFTNEEAEKIHTDLRLVERANEQIEQALNRGLATPIQLAMLSQNNLFKEKCLILFDSSHPEKVQKIRNSLSDVEAVAVNVVVLDRIRDMSLGRRR